MKHQQPSKRLAARSCRVFLLAIAAISVGCSSSRVNLAPTPDEAAPITGTASAVELGNAFARVADAVRPAVVYIRAETAQPAPFRPTNVPSRYQNFFPPRSRFATGTGFIVQADGYIVTNHHVIQHAQRIVVRLYDQREFEARIVGGDSLTDLAVLKIDESNLPAASLGNSDGVRVGEWVLAIGNPLGSALMFTVTAGIVSATGRSMLPPTSSSHVLQDFIQTDAAANSGNSGGPLVDLSGRIVGVNAAIASVSGYYQGYTLAIPVNLALPIVSQLIERGRVARAVLGVAAADATSEDATAVGLDSVHGVLVQDVGGERSQARRAGLRPGDVIVAIDGHPVNYVAQMHQQVWFRSAGDTVLVSVHREGGQREILRVGLTAMDEEAPEDPEDEYGWDPPEPRPRCSGNALGVCFSELNPDMAYDFNISPRHAGLVVRGVSSVGPSHGKIFADMDIITHVNGVRVYAAADLEQALVEIKSGDIVPVQTYRFRTSETRFARVRIR